MEVLVPIMRLRLAVQNDGRFTLYPTVLKTRHVIDHLFFFNGGRESKEEGATSILIFQPELRFFCSLLIQNLTLL